jgi:hypothetical protein
MMQQLVYKARLNSNITLQSNTVLRQYNFIYEVNVYKSMPLNNIIGGVNKWTLY